MTSGHLGTKLQHPLLALADDLDALKDRYSDAPAWTLPPVVLPELLKRFAVHENWFDSVVLTTLREADRQQVGDAVGAANTAAWWANTTRCTKQDAHRQVALAARLDEDAHTPTAEALGRGEVSVDQAGVILNAVEALPAELVPPALRRDAETHLVALAEHHDPRELRILGRRILDVIAPEVSEEHERQVLEREERDALATASFTMNPDGHGSMIGRFKIPALAGEMLRKHLDAIAAPRHQAATGPLGEKVARPLRLGQAFAEYIETRNRQGLPKAGGIAATVVVTMTLQDLLGAAKAATLDTGEKISAAEARRLACEAGIIPMVLGSRSQVLDLGRRARFHTEAQRIALAQHHQGCAVEGCDWPPGMCHAHHLLAWSKGGATTVVNGILICPPHHRTAHDDRYQLKATKNGRVTFSKRE